MPQFDSSLIRDDRPTLETARLCLRPSTIDDAERISEILNDRAIPDTAMHIPHPFDSGLAREWIANHPQKYHDGKSVDFYITERATQNLIGALHIDINRNDRNAEFGYYIAHERWGNGFATEAVQSGVQFSFDTLEIDRVFAWTLCRNGASRRVLEKAGFQPEGILRQHVMKWNRLEDVQYFGILKAEYNA